MFSKFGEIQILGECGEPFFVQMKTRFEKTRLRAIEDRADIDKLLAFDPWHDAEDGVFK